MTLYGQNDQNVYEPPSNISHIDKVDETQLRSYQKHGEQTQ